MKGWLICRQQQRPGQAEGALPEAMAGQGYSVLKLGSPGPQFCSFSSIFLPSALPETFLKVEENTFSEALELSGTPFPYFPEIIPQASGDHVIAPTPVGEKQHSHRKLLCQVGPKVRVCLNRTLSVLEESWPNKWVNTSIRLSITA